jgi:hypothetical protein
MAIAVGESYFDWLERLCIHQRSNSVEVHAYTEIF